MHIVLLWQKVVDSDLLMMLMVINGTFYGMPSIPSVVGKREIPSHKLRLLAVNTNPIRELGRRGIGVRVVLVNFVTAIIDPFCMWESISLDTRAIFFFSSTSS